MRKQKQTEGGGVGRLPLCQYQRDRAILRTLWTVTGESSRSDPVRRPTVTTPVADPQTRTTGTPTNLPRTTCRRYRRGLEQPLRQYRPERDRGDVPSDVLVRGTLDPRDRPLVETRP